MRRVGVAVQQADGHALDALCGDGLQHRCDRRLIERDKGFAVDVEPLAHRQPPGAAHQRQGLDDVQIVLIEPAFRAHFQHVAEALGGHEQGLRAAPFDHGVCCQRRAVDDLVDVRKRDPGLCAGRGHAVQHGAFRFRAGGQQLGRMETTVAILKGDIGECAADVDAEAPSGDCVRHNPLHLPARPESLRAPVSSS